MSPSSSYLQETVTLGERRIVYSMRKSRRAKHVLLHVDERGEVELVVPRWVSYARAQRFLYERASWLDRQLTKVEERDLVPRRQLTSGSTVPYFGDFLAMQVIVDRERKRARAVRRGNDLHLLVRRPHDVRSALVRWYRRQARAYFWQVSDEYAVHLGVSVRSVRIGDHKSQCGSCTGEGALSFNWRLLLGPEFVARYVAAHEVVHILHHNHSPAYWQTLERVYPEMKEAKQWLKKAGHTLVL